MGDTPVGIIQVFSKCAAHSGVADILLWGILAGNPDSESRRNGGVLHKLLTDFVGILSESFVQEDGSTSLRFKQGITVSFTWSGADLTRVLTVTITGISLTNPQKNSINNYCTTAFGAGRVVLVN